MLPIQRKISSYNYNSTNSVRYIVIHDVGAYGTAKNNVDYFYGGNRGASAHYFVDDNSIWQSVEDYHGAWHVGDNNGYGKFAFGITNSNSIGIEMCLPSHDVTELTENNTIELVRYLMNKYNVPAERVVRHYDASRKNCPATFSANNWARWNKFKTKLNGNYTQPTIKNEEDYKMELFSENWYLKRNPDVAAAVKKGVFKTGYHHYIQNGKAEGRKPLPPIPQEYCEGDYLELNSDVAAAVKKGTFTSGLEHFMVYGFDEKRKINKVETDSEMKKRVEELELKLEEIKKIID